MKIFRIQSKLQRPRCKVLAKYRALLTKKVSLLNLRNYKVFFFVIIAVLALLIASLALQTFLVLPQTEYFSEMSLLGSTHLAKDYPFNITRGANYNIFLTIGNHLDNSANYMIKVKFRNQTQSAPNSFSRTPSTLPSLHDLTAVVPKNESWELPIVFSFDYAFNANLNQISFRRLNFNELTLDLNGYSSSWNSESQKFSGTLFFELWIYNDEINGFQYHSRYVSLPLNMIVNR